MTDADPPWAHGFPLSFLKEVAGLFREEFAPHSYGAFGMPKERDVAAARLTEDLVWTRAGGNAICGAGFARYVRRATPHEDFAGRRAVMQPADTYVSRLAGTGEGKARVLASLLGRHNPIWVEGHVENAELVALLGELQFVRVMTKVAASSDLKGLWLKGEPKGRAPAGFSAADNLGVKVLDEAWLAAAERDAILAECAAHGAWAQHYSGYNKRQSWTAFALAGYDPSDPGFIVKPAEMSRQWKAENPKRLDAKCGPTLAAQHFPAALAQVARIPGEKQRVRLMRLAAGGELSRHADITDPEAGTADGKVVRLHVPLSTDPAIEFRSWGMNGAEHRLHMPERALCYLDTRKPHAVANPAQRERIHLVVDVHSSPELRRLLLA